MNSVIGHGKARFKTLADSVEYQIVLALALVRLVVWTMSRKQVANAVVVADMNPRKGMEKYEISAIGTGKDLSHQHCQPEQQLEALTDRSVVMVHLRRGAIRQLGARAALRKGHAHLGANSSSDLLSTVHRLLPNLTISGGQR